MKDSSTRLQLSDDIIDQIYAEQAMLSAIRTLDQLEQLKLSNPDWIFDAAEEVYRQMCEYASKYDDIMPHDVIRSIDKEWEFAQGDFGHWFSHYKRARRITRIESALKEYTGGVREDADQAIERVLDTMAEIRNELPRDSELVWASEIQEQPIEYVIFNRVYRGKLHLLGGLEGTGKSTLLLNVAGPLTRGDPVPWLDIAPERPLRVLFISYEDGAADTLKRRARLAGAEMSNVAFWSDDNLPPAIPDDLSKLERYIDTSKIDWVIIDPIDSALAERIDSHKSHSVRRALHGLSRMAERTGAAVTFVMHPTKGDSEDPFKRISGSRAFTAAARSCDYFGRDPDDQNKLVLVQFKNNLGPPQQSLTFQLERAGLEGVRMVHTGYSELGAEDLLASARSRRVSKRDVAKEFLAEMLRKEPMAVADLQDKAKRMKISWSTFETAKRELATEGVRIEPFQVWDDESKKSAWHWKLQTEGDSDLEPSDSDPGRKSSKGNFLRPGSISVEVSPDLSGSSEEDPDRSHYGLGPESFSVENRETQAVNGTKTLRPENPDRYVENDPGRNSRVLGEFHGLGRSEVASNGAVDQPDWYKRVPTHDTDGAS